MTKHKLDRPHPPLGTGAESNAGAWFAFAAVAAILGWLWFGS